LFTVAISIFTVTRDPVRERTKPEWFDYGRGGNLPIRKMMVPGARPTVRPQAVMNLVLSARNSPWKMYDQVHPKEK